jgi:hypothetical protein
MFVPAMFKERVMQTIMTQWSLIFLNFSIAVIVGGGFYEHIVLTPLWKSSPPLSFSIVQPKTGIPLQRFWIPVHIVINVFLPLSIFLTWSDSIVCLLLLGCLASYVIMRVWSALYFIPEMLAFQKIPPNSTPTVELSARVIKWTFWTKFREPLVIISFLCSLLALYWSKCS